MKNDGKAAHASSRIPFDEDLAKRFNLDEEQWRLLVDGIFPNVESVESIGMALSYCAARKLDIFTRPVHVVPVWDKRAKRNRDTVWAGINELRTTAARTREYAGKDETKFGPLTERTWTRDEDGKNKTIKLSYPEWAQVTVYRMVAGQRCPFVGPKVYWQESFTRAWDGGPNHIWERRPSGQLEKVAEASALRLAFPEEIGNEYIDAEAHVPEQRNGRPEKPPFKLADLTDEVPEIDVNSDLKDVGHKVDTPASVPLVEQPNKVADESESNVLLAGMTEEQGNAHVASKVSADELKLLAGLRQYVGCRTDAEYDAVIAFVSPVRTADNTPIYTTLAKVLADNQQKCLLDALRRNWRVSGKDLIRKALAADTNRIPF